MDELKIIENLKKDIRSQIGRSLDSPSDFDFLSAQIKHSLHEYISPTTLKRFFNYIPNDVKPRISTLSLLSRFVGAAGWQDYCNEFCEGVSASEGEGTPVGAKTDEAVPNPQNAHGYTDIKKIHSAPDGFCEIYKARRFGRWHALKTLKNEFKEDVACMEQLYNEFNNVYLRTHPNLVRSVGYETVGDLGECIVMEYVEGDNIIDYIKTNALSRDQVWSLVKELAVVLDFIHANGISHNCICADNVLVTYDGGHVKLMDFAKSTGNYYTKYKEYPDYGSFVELMKDINATVPGGFSRFRQFVRRYEEGKKAGEMMNLAELVDVLVEKVNYIPLIFSIAIVFSAVVSSLLTFRISNSQNLGRHVFIDSLQIEGRYVKDLSTTLVVFDTLSQIVIDYAKEQSKKSFSVVDTIEVRNQKFAAYSKIYRSLVKDKEVFPVQVLDKYMPKDSPEYNLYKTSLMQLVEDEYTKYYQFKVDSLRSTK